MQQSLFMKLLPIRIMLPFCVGYGLSYFSRNIGAILADDFTLEFAINANSLGLLTSVYFLAFAMCQIPLGLLLDKFQPQKIEAIFLIFAAIGAFLTAIAQESTLLSVGRIMMGFGVSACLMAAYREILHWFPMERVPLLNGIVLVFGGLGAMISGWPPTADFVIEFGWRNIFYILAVSFLIASLLLWFLVPEIVDDVLEEGDGQAVQKPKSLLIEGMVKIVCSRHFWIIMPIAATTQALALSINGLWVVPWFMRVEGFSLKETTFIMFFIALSMTIGQFLAGWLGSRCKGSDKALYKLMLWGSIVGILAMMLVSVRVNIPTVALWIIFTLFTPFAMLAYPMLAQKFPDELGGRAITLINFSVFFLAFLFQWLIGAIIGSIEAEHTTVDLLRFQLGFGLATFVSIIAVLWSLISDAMLKDKKGLGI